MLGWIKRLNFGTIIFAVALSAACTGNHGDKTQTAESRPENKRDGMKSVSAITMSANPAAYTLPVDRVRVKVRNNSTEDVTAGDDYMVELYKDDCWKEVPLHYAFHDIGIVIFSGNEKTFDIDLQSDRYDYTRGLYRIKKEVLVDSPVGMERKELYAEFEIR